MSASASSSFEINDEPRKANADAPNSAPSSGFVSLLFADVAMSALRQALAKRTPANNRGFASWVLLIVLLLAVIVECRLAVVSRQHLFAAALQPIGASIFTTSANSVARTARRSRGGFKGGIVKAISRRGRPSKIATIDRKGSQGARVPCYRSSGLEHCPSATATKGRRTDARPCTLHRDAHGPVVSRHPGAW